jgi:hypothetical protein
VSTTEGVAQKSYELHSLSSLRWRLRNAIESLACKPAKESLPDCLARVFCQQIAVVPANRFPNSAQLDFETLSGLMDSEPEYFKGEGTVRATTRSMRISGYPKARKAAALICRLEIAVSRRIEELLRQTAH